MSQKRGEGLSLERRGDEGLSLEPPEARRLLGQPQSGTVRVEDGGKPHHDRQRLKLSTTWKEDNELGLARSQLGPANLELGAGEPAMPGLREEFHQSAADLLKQQSSLAGCHFADLGTMFNEALQTLTWERRSKTLSTVREAIFPLPLGVYPNISSEQQGWLIAILRGLNSLYGCAKPSPDPPSELQRNLVSGLLPFLDRMLNWSEEVPPMDLDELFRYKGVDYRGEEVKLAKAFEWNQIEGALPDGVGTLKLEEFFLAGCRHFVEDFTRFLVAPEQQQLGRTPRVMVAPEKWEEIASGLLKKGICEVLPRTKLHHVKGEPLLNGLFAVSKNEYLDGIELRRLLMNLVPLNRLCK